jgi:hypothetical protein
MRSKRGRWVASTFDNKPTPTPPGRGYLWCNLHYNISVIIEQSDWIFTYFTFPYRGLKWRNAGSE